MGRGQVPQTQAGRSTVRRTAAKLFNSRSVTVAVLLLLLVSALTQWINFGDTRALVREVFIGRSLGQVRTRAGAPTPQEECRYVPSSQLLKQARPNPQVTIMLNSLHGVISQVTQPSDGQLGTRAPLLVLEQ
jgi:hypothetical protein